MRNLSPVALGVVFALASYSLYAVSDALIKSVGDGLGIFEIGLIATSFSLLPAIFAKPAGDRWRDSFRFNRPWLVHLIGVLRTGSAVLVTYSFVTIPLAEVYCIVFLVPVFTTLLSVLVLREKVSGTRWTLILLSFAGVVLMVRPGFRDLQLGHLTALACSLCSATAVVATRLTSGNERRISLFLVPLLYTIAFDAVMLSLGFRLPNLTQLLLLVACGLIGGTGYLMQINALERAPASRVAPLQYSQIVWALVFGLLFFAEVPDGVGIIGLVVVVVAGITNVFADGARARIAGRWAEYRALRPATGPTGFRGPGPDPL